MVASVSLLFSFLKSSSRRCSQTFQISHGTEFWFSPPQLLFLFVVSVIDSRVYQLTVASTKLPGPKTLPHPVPVQSAFKVCFSLVRFSTSLLPTSLPLICITAWSDLRWITGVFPLGSCPLSLWSILHSGPSVPFSSHYDPAFLKPLIQGTFFYQGL